MSGVDSGLVLIWGDEELLVERAVRRAVALARETAPEVERRDAEAAGLTPADFSDLVAPSLFAEPRVVVIGKAQESAKELAVELLRYAGDPVEGVTLVVQHAGGARNKALADGLRKAGASVMTCAKITRHGARVEFVRAEIRQAGGRTNPDAVAALVEAVGTDLRELAAAANQLVADTGGTVDEAAVRRYHQGRAEVSGFAIADLAVVGDIPSALEALRWALSVGTPHVLIADALADGVRTVAKVADTRGGNAHALASRLGMPPWKVEKAQRVARGWSESGLVTAISAVAALNGEVKGQAVDSEYALEKAVIAVGRARRRTAAAQ